MTMQKPQNTSDNVTELPVKDRKKQVRAFTDMAQVNKLQEKTGWNDAELQANLGYKSGAIVQWRKDGTCPVTTSLAAECLLRRMGLANKPKHYIITVGFESSDLVMDILDKFGVVVKEL